MAAITLATWLRDARVGQLEWLSVDLKCAQTLMHSDQVKTHDVMTVSLINDARLILKIN